MIQRTFDYVPRGGGDVRPVTVTVDDPRPVGTGWGAVLRIEGLNQSYEQTIMGIDGFQAVLGAIALVPHVTRTMLEGGKLRWLGKKDLKCRTSKRLR